MTAVDFKSAFNIMTYTY